MWHVKMSWGPGLANATQIEYGAPGMTGSLASDQVNQYWHDGFLFPLTLMHPAEAQTWRGKLEQFDDRYRHDPSLHRPFDDYLRANLHIVSTAAAEIAHHPAILDAVESLIGPDLLVWMVELIVKPPNSEAMVSMHQDLTYWGLDGIDGLVTAWVALSDVTVANGAMTFVAGSHRFGQVDHADTFGENNLLSRGQQVSFDHDPHDEASVELAAGQVSLHHGLTFHGSGPNQTEVERVGLAIRYIEPEVRQRVGARDYAMTVRGANHTGHLISVAPPSRNCEPGALALFDEITEAQAVALAVDAAGALGYTR